MAYQRFVTYLFQYKNGKKEENCGFAKVEVRQEHARMEIFVRGVPDGTDRVYLFAVAGGIDHRGERNFDESEQDVADVAGKTDADSGIRRNESGQKRSTSPNHALEGVYIGNLVVSNGMGRARFAFDADAVQGTPYGMDDMAGIYIKSAGGFLGSQWVDEELDWGSFREYEASVENAAKEISISHDVKPSEQPAEMREAWMMQDTNPVWQKAVDHPVVRDCVEEKNCANDVQENYGQCSESILPNESGETPKNLSQSSTEELHATQAAIAAVRTEIPRQQPRVSFKNPQDARQALGIAAGPQRVSSYMNTWERQWRQFTESHPLFCPFDEATDILAVKMDLRDFKLLPKSYLPLANNSFLLHGYFNYKYLLFGYMDGEPRRWFLGVPGVFQNQEQLLAGLFGFGEFRTKHLTKQKTGEFGYWYRYLEP